MALFKIEKGVSANLTSNRPNTINGYCYFTTDEGKMYIDIKDGQNTAADTSYRVALNAHKADLLATARTITLSGDAAGSVNFDGSQNVNLVVSIEELDNIKEAIEVLETKQPDLGEVNEQIQNLNNKFEEYLPLTAGSDKKLTGPLGLTAEVNYGPELPTEGLFEGQIFYLESENDILPPGGTTGQALIKNSNTNGDASWKSITDLSLPSGGKAGQALVKNSTTTGDASWKDIVALPKGGTAGQVLIKNSSTDGDASWSSASIGGGGVGTWDDIINKPDYYDAKAITSITRSGTTFTATYLDGTISTFTQQDNNTTYTAGTGISISSNSISNSGVRSIATGSTNGTISVNTNGTTANVAVKGLGSAAYTASTAYDAAGAATTALNDAKTYADGKFLPLSGGTLTGKLKLPSSQYNYSTNANGYALDLSNSDIIQVNSLYFCDASNNMGEGIHFYRDGTTWDSIAANNGTFYFAAANEGTTALGGTATIRAGAVYGAVWNDYAEYREQEEEIKPGYCVTSSNDGKVRKTTEKFQACDGIVSDTFGFAIGETNECKTPLAVAGRVLAYCEGSRYNYDAGDTVCAGPDGRVVKMTREEIREWPDRIVGIVSEIPEYETWGTGNVLVDDRIWIKVK